MARPKGVIQARDESKYSLPEGVTLKSGQTSQYGKETKLVFIDSKHGEFTSSFKSIQKANASVHPRALSERKSLNNPGMVPGSREKARTTTKQRYGVEFPSQNPEFHKKAMDTYRKNNKQEDVNSVRENTVLARHGVINVMQVQDFKANQVNSLVETWGVTNPNYIPHVPELRMQNFITNGNRSKEELELVEFIESLDLKAERTYIGGKPSAEIDIIVKEKSIAFEMNGCYWHSEHKGRDRAYHLFKTTKMAEKGIKLIHIFDKEWHTRKFQIKSFIRSALGKNEHFFYAREGELRKVSSEEARDFLERYHILGKTTMKGALGLYFNNMLVSLVTYNAHHRNTEEFLLNRYVTMNHVTVVGGLSRLSKALYKEIGEFNTFIDLRFSDGKAWLKCGYEELSVSRPDYFYYDLNGHKIIAKQSRKKSAVKTPEGMTEREHAIQDGLTRIWDCGKIKLKYKG